MAEFRITVIVDPKGAVRGGKAVERQLKRTGQAADRTRSLIARAFGFAAVAAGVRQLVTVTDAFQNMNNRLRTVTTSQETLNNTMSALEGVARRTRTGLDGIVTLYQRGAIAAGQLGITNERLVGFVEKVGQALAIQGASAATTRGALLQLSQALGSSIVRAEEFNSILEGAFPIAQAAAEGIDRAGGSVARLRQLILAGEVTSKQFFVGFEKGAKNLKKIFETTVPTIGQGFVVLRDSITLFIGRLDASFKISETFARSLLSLAFNLDNIARVAGAAAIVIGVVFVKAVAAAGIALAAFALSNPFTAIALGITSLIALLVTFADKLKLPGQELANLKDFALAAFEVIGEEMEFVFNFFKKAANDATKFVQSRFGDVATTFTDVSKVAGIAVNTILGHYLGLLRAYTLIFKKIGDLGREAIGSPFGKIVGKVVNTIIGWWARLFAFVGKGVAKFSEFVKDEAASVTKALGKEFKDDRSTVGAALRFGQDVKDAYLSGFDVDFLGALATALGPKAGSIIAEINKRAEAGAAKRIERERIATEKARKAGLGPTANKPRDVADPVVEKFLKNLELENKLLRVNSVERERLARVLALETDLKRELLPKERLRVDLAIKMNQQLAIQSEEFDLIRDPLLQYQQRIAAINAELARPGGITSDEAAKRVRELNIALLETSTDTTAGLQRGFLKAQSAVDDFAAGSEKIITDAFSGATDAIGDFFLTGKLNAEDFFRTMAANFAKLAAQAALSAAFGNGGTGGGDGFSSGFGGIISSAITSGLTGGLTGFKDGGSFLVGAGTAQARIPGIDNRLVAFKAQDGEKVTVTPKNENGAGSGTVNQVFNIQTPDADSFQRSQTQVQNRANAGLSRARGRA